MNVEPRKEKISIYLNEEEYKLLLEKFKVSGINKLSNFIRRCIFRKEIFVVDMTPLRKIQQLLSNQCSNINQIAKRINSTGVIYKEDIEYIKKSNEVLSEEFFKLQNFISKKVYK